MHSHEGICSDLSYFYFTRRKKKKKDYKRKHISPEEETQIAKLFTGLPSHPFFILDWKAYVICELVTAKSLGCQYLAVQWWFAQTTIRVARNCYLFLNWGLDILFQHHWWGKACLFPQLSNCSVPESRDINLEVQLTGHMLSEKRLIAACNIYRIFFLFCNWAFKSNSYVVSWLCKWSTGVQSR